MSWCHPHARRAGSTLLEVQFIFRACDLQLGNFWWSFKRAWAREVPKGRITAFAWAANGAGRRRRSKGRSQPVHQDAGEGFTKGSIKFYGNEGRSITFGPCRFMVNAVSAGMGGAFTVFEGHLHHREDLLDGGYYPQGGTAKAAIWRVILEMVYDISRGLRRTGDIAGGALYLGRGQQADVVLRSVAPLSSRPRNDPGWTKRRWGPWPPQRWLSSFEMRQNR